MTSTDFGYMPSDRQELRIARNLGDALAAVVKAKWPFHTAKHVEATFGLDREAAANVVKAKGSATALTRGVHALQTRDQTAWALWMAIGKELIGEPYEAFEARVLNHLIEENNRAISNIESLRARRATLEAAAADAGLVDGLGSPSRRRG